MSKEEVKKKIKVVKSPIPDGVERLPVSSSVGLVTVSIMLPSGIVITSPEQFEDYNNQDMETHAEDYRRHNEAE